ncbi:MAG: restriction endonuclease subunit S, partial [Gammaproteobacteria bacterium]|nr:restriction endonuclease subunit S [Gammaproteobacteria bacterium]
MVDLPESWVAIALSDAVSNIAITDKKIPQKEYLSEGAYPVFDQGRDYIGGYSEKKEKLVDCELPVLVFGDHTRVVKFVSQPFAPGADGIKVLQPQLFYNPRLLEYFTRHIATHLTNHGYARHYQHLMKSEIPLPPTNEQHRIVAKIEELFSELDKGIENLKTARAQLKVYRQALLKHAFEGKLTAISSGAAWPEKALGDLLDFLTSGSRGWAQYYAAAGDLFIRAQNIKHDQLDLSDIAFVSLPERTEGLRTRVKIGDLLITITGANVTKSALVERDVGTAYVSQHVALCRPTAEVIPRFLYWFI